MTRGLDVTYVSGKLKNAPERLKQRAATRLKRDGSLQVAIAWADNSKSLSKPEGSAAYDLSVDDDVHAIGADSHRAGTQIVVVLTASNSEV